MSINYHSLFAETEKQISDIAQKANAEIKAIEDDFMHKASSLFSDIGWNRWADTQPNSAQYSKIQKSLTGKMKLISINHQNKSGRVKGSTIYDVSEDGCSCMNFSIDRCPCKHMYFLAFHLADGTQIEQESNQQITFDSLNDNSLSEKDMDNIDEIVENYGQLGCCSLYRECSQKGHCLQTDEYYQQCGYRRNLESSKVFYTEKSYLFSQERYDYIVDFYNSLQGTEKAVFNELVTYFMKTKRACQSCLCVPTNELKTIIEKCKAFEFATPQEVTFRVFDAELMCNTRAERLHEKYSKRQKPELLPKIPNPKPSKDATAEEHKKYESNKKKNQEIDEKNLETWKKHFLEDNDLPKVLSKAVFYFSLCVDYQNELNEFFVKNYNSICVRYDDYFSKYDTITVFNKSAKGSPNIFRDIIDKE